jgi:hypothetical protein
VILLQWRIETAEISSVCYFETGNRTISRTRPDSLKWAKSRSVANDALVLFGTDSLAIEPARSDKY